MHQTLDTMADLFARRSNPRNPIGWHYAVSDPLDEVLASLATIVQTARQPLVDWNAVADRWRDARWVQAWLEQAGPLLSSGPWLRWVSRVLIAGDQAAWDALAARMREIAGTPLGDQLWQVEAG